MIYVNDTDYKYVVSRSDNYIVLTNQKNVSASYQNPVEIDTLTQYLYPSTYFYEGVQTVTTNRSYDSVEVTDDFWARSDMPLIFTSYFCMLFILIFIINIFTKLLRPGGVFFG